VSLTAFAVDDDGDRARAAVRPHVVRDLSGGPNVFTDAQGTSEELAGILDRGGPALLDRELPDWSDELAVAGDPSECALAIARQLEAGADAVVVLPLPVERADEGLRVLAEEIVPRLPTATTSKGESVHAEG
jgi:alkanesulfonate monooxygenase SsuD/methylene tetrahydromethanopterin reductase-like flavin-dependent oxidoreductase (luciferase family)